MAKFLNSDGLTRLVALIKQALGGKQDLLDIITNSEIDQIVGETSPLPYDAEIEYLAASGTQRIHTGITGNARFTGSAQANIIKGSSQLVLCGRADASGACWFGEAGSARYWGVNTTSGAYVSIAPTTQITFYLDFNSSGVNGTVNASSIARSGSTTRDEWSIFASTNGSYPLSGKVYFLKIYQNDNLVRDFIPVRVGTTGYMYDKVSGQLFGNAGTGNFILGNDVTT